MCGICGLLSFDSDFTVDTLKAMNSCLKHRGPDEEGIFIDRSLGLAHQRLSIIDPETGQQPIFNENDSVVTVFNGELYNHVSLRKSLIKCGHSFSTMADTEVIVHLYEEYGPSFVDRLEGMFAFALWDSTEERLLLSRDPMGIKPLFLANDGNSIAFASELPALLESDVDHGGIDETSLSQYFGLGYIPAPRTAFANIRKLEPGETIVISEDRIETTNRYLPTIEPRDVSFGEAVRGLHTRVENAVEKRLISDVPIGAFLSGGIDSSIIVGMMSNQTDEPVQTFTVGFGESLFDESWAAREVADYHDTDHTEYTVTPKEIQSAIPEVLDRLGEPFADQSIVPTYVVSREASRDVKVALSGDGADELFAGYSRYRGEYYSRYYRTIPSTVRRSLIEPMINGLDASRNSSRGEIVRKAQKFVRGRTSDIADRHFEWVRIADDGSLSTFNGMNPGESGREILHKEHEIGKSYLPEGRQDDMSCIQAVDTHFGLPNQILHKTDRASMYNSLEVRVPFLDTDVVEYAMSLPTNYKITPRKQKRVLKRAFDDVLPKAILERSKQGFDMPIGEWFKHELEDEFTATVSGLDTHLVDTSAVMDRFADHKTGTREHGKFLWAVYVFARWHRRMQNQGII
jgi:asparagine synthase (glutamine-hydrolysing)